MWTLQKPEKPGMYFTLALDKKDYGPILNPDSLNAQFWHGYWWNEPIQFPPTDLKNFDDTVIQKEYWDDIEEFMNEVTEETLDEQEPPLYIPIDEFIAGMNLNAFTDDDGYGYLAKVVASNLEPCVDDTRVIYPSTLKDVENIGYYTHILWFNK